MLMPSLTVPIAGERTEVGDQHRDFTIHARRQDGPREQAVRFAQLLQAPETKVPEQVRLQFAAGPVAPEGIPALGAGQGRAQFDDRVRARNRVQLGVEVAVDQSGQPFFVPDFLEEKTQFLQMDFAVTVVRLHGRLLRSKSGTR